MIIPNEEARAFLDAWSARLDAGAADSEIRIYGGPVPAAAEDSRAGNTLLAVLTLSGDTFQPAVDFGPFAQITGNPITPGTGLVVGLATFADFVDGDGVVRGQATVGPTESNAQVQLDAVNIAVGTAVSISLMEIRMNEAPAS